VSGGGVQEGRKGGWGRGAGGQKGRGGGGARLPAPLEIIQSAFLSVTSPQPPPHVSRSCILSRMPLGRSWNWQSLCHCL
jgi:hypothetical protein